MTEEPYADRPPTTDPGRRWRFAGQVAGEVLVTLGLILLLFVFYELYVTDWFSARKQDAASQRLEDRWSRPAPAEPDPRPGADAAPASQPPPADGEGFARMYIPAFGPEYAYTVMEGTGRQALAAGPGHYSDTAMPGQAGNFAMAGHRIGKGAPFGDLNTLGSCDAVVVETRTDWFVYRVLPMPGEQAGWSGRGDPRCERVAPLGGQYAGLPGREIVRPQDYQVVDPVPGNPNPDLAPGQRAGLITLTTCHPRYSNAQRLIVHGVLTKQYRKDPRRADLRPAELAEKG